MWVVGQETTWSKKFAESLYEKKYYLKHRELEIVKIDVWEEPMLEETYYSYITDDPGHALMAFVSSLN